MTIEGSKAHADRVRDNHNLHWLALLSVAMWAGSVFGWLVGVGFFIGLYCLIAATNLVIMATGGDFRAIRVSRWGWLVIALASMIALSAETIRA